jgi:hypothetical protein
MSSEARLMPRLAGAATLVVTAVCLCFSTAFAQKSNPPNPYHEVSQWAKLPAGVAWGGVISVDPAPNGDIWVFHRSDPPLLRFDQSGTVVKSFGAGLFVQAHGMSVDADGNVWVTDAQAKDGKGQQVFKFSPEGKVLLTLGKAGVAGEGPIRSAGRPTWSSRKRRHLVTRRPHREFDRRTRREVLSGAFVKAWASGAGPGRIRHAACHRHGLAGRISSPTARTTASRLSIRTGDSSSSGSSSAGRAGCSSIDRTRSTWRTRSRMPR